MLISILTFQTNKALRRHFEMKLNFLVLYVQFTLHFFSIKAKIV